MSSFHGPGRLLGAGALELLDAVDVDIRDDSASANFHGWLIATGAIASQLDGLDGLELELPGGHRLPVVVGGCDERGRVPVIGRGRLPA